MRGKDSQDGEREPDYEEELEIGKKKKYSKKGYMLPGVQFGFRAQIAHDVIDPRNLPRPRRRKPKSTQHSSKESFLSRLRMVVDPHDLPCDISSHQFRVGKMSDWNWVKKVYYRSRDQVYCSICLEENIIAPQITFCGHIFCFHCILMHFKKSQNSGVCPVCKEFTQETELKTCEPRCDTELNIGDEITLGLKYRSGRTIYHSETLIEDLNFEQIIRMRTKGVLQIFEKEHKVLEGQLLRTLETDRNHLYLVQALDITSKKIEQTKKIMQTTPKHIKLRQNQKIVDNTVVRMTSHASDVKFQQFYQERSGRFIFLHQLSKRYLISDQKLPNNLTVKIMEKEQIWYGDHANQYPELIHLNKNVEIDLIIVDIQNAVEPVRNEAFHRDFQEYLKKKQQIERKQQAEAEYMSKCYEEQKQYMRKLKQLQSAQYQINVPTDLDPSQLNENTFPSLIREAPEANEVKEIPEPPKVLQKQKTHQAVQKISAEDFPDICDLKAVQSTEPQKKQEGGGGKKNKKRKQKKVDMTHLIFADRQEDFD